MQILDKITVTSVLGVLLCSPAVAQETLGSIGAASGIGATLGAAGAGALSAKRATKGAGGQNRDQAMQDLMRDDSGGGNRSATTVAVTSPAVSRAVDWGNGNGNQILNQLLATKPLPQPIKAKRSPAGQAKYARKVSKMTPKERSKMVQAPYHPKPVNWIAHYLKEDRYKITTGQWEVVSTETDKYYYKPWAAGMLRQTPNRVIGFHTWQDAMLAGYRPDPVTQPVPGAEFAKLARIGRGQHFVEYVEYAYAGQVSPQNFRATYNYALQVINAVNAYPYARPLLPDTLDRVFEATLAGDPSMIPRSIGGQPQVVAVTTGDISAETASNANAARAGGAPPPEPDGQGDKREEDFNKFKGNAGKLANVPGNN